MNKKHQDLLKIMAVYAIAIFTGYYSIQSFKTGSAVLDLFQADLAATIVVFIGSGMLKNSSTYDAYWSVIPILFLVYWLDIAAYEITIRSFVSSLLVTIWGVRLTYNWYRGWNGLHHEDWRYIDLKQKTKYFYPFVNLAGIHLFPTLLVFLGCLSLQPIFLSKVPFNVFDLIGAVVLVMGIYFEWRADRELHLFKQTRKSEKDILSTGIWGWCRHPNYFGEINIWIGLFFMAIGANANLWPYAAGAIGMILLFTFVSIPMIDKRMLKKRPDYQKIKDTTPALLPLGLFKK